jgi:hypothetical protein
MPSIVVGFAGSEAESPSDGNLGQAGELPEGDHADLPLDDLVSGEGEHFTLGVGKYEQAVFQSDI